MDATRWAAQTLAPLLEPGEQILTLGYARNVPDHPIGYDYNHLRRPYEGMRDNRGKPITNGEVSGFVVLTAARMLIAPGLLIDSSRPTAFAFISGVVEVRWSSVVDIVEPTKKGDKRFMNVVVHTPNPTVFGPSAAMKFMAWNDEKGMPSQADFIARWVTIAKECSAAARAANLPRPPFYVRALTCQYTCSDLAKLPDWARAPAPAPVSFTLPASAPANLHTPAPWSSPQAVANAPTKKSGNSGLLWVLGIILVIAGIALIQHGQTHRRDEGATMFGFIALGIAGVVIKQARK